ncbi:hypothetical protein M0R19_08540 [Candidatus Pacearchaeota archaeon]|nr:hypothetical protein [bacterium]MCK9597205.1 hypothetical protein [Candidatus Pacearchaeota archaeon]
MNKFMIIATDFDGTIAQEGNFPKIGEPISGAIETLIECRKIGHKIILYTCREGKHLQEAVEWCKERGLEFDAVNKNYIEVDDTFSKSKPYWDVLIDDRNFSPYHRNITPEVWGIFRHYLVEEFTKKENSNG